MMNDERLIQDLKAGDREALRLLYESHKDRLFTLARGLLGDASGAEDVVHDVFIGFVESLHKYHVKGRLGAYLAALLPAGYAAVEAVVKHFILSEDSVSFEYPEPNGTAVYSVGRMTGIFSTGVTSEEEARAQYEEFLQLYREGKAQEIRPGVWQATLANGERFNYGGDPEHTPTEFTAQEKEQWKKQFDEINELRKAGKGERTFREEIERDGVRIRLYEVRYTLPDGNVVTLTEGVGADGRGGFGGGGLGGGGSSGDSVR